MVNKEKVDAVDDIVSEVDSDVEKEVAPVDNRPASSDLSDTDPRSSRQVYNMTLLGVKKRLIIDILQHDLIGSKEKVDY